jgi:aspartate aminotransferase
LIGVVDFSQRIRGIKESATLKFKPLINKLLREGHQVTNFAMGELDFETLSEVNEATKKALDEQKTRYSATSGIAALKEAICVKLQRENHVSYGTENILASNGSKQILYELFQVLCNAGDEVIVPRPYWVSYPEQIKSAGGVPVVVDTEDHQLDAGAIQNAITDKTKAIVLNSPCNPTGAVFAMENVKAVAEIAVEKGITIISDEAYELLVYDDIDYVSTASLSDEIKKNTVTVHSFSKPFGMTGFRIGYCAAETDIIKQLGKLQSHVSSGPCTFSQYGAVAAALMKRDEIKRRVGVLEKRRNAAYMCARKYFDCIKPQGAFYIFPDVSSVLHGKSADDFAMHLLRSQHVALVPSEGFGVDRHIRISYTASEGIIKNGFEKIGKGIESFR